jgi:integrase
VNIKHVKIKKGIKSVLTYWYKGNRYRPTLQGVNLTGDEEKRAANQAIAEIHRLVDAAGRSPDMTVAKFVPVYERELAVNQRVDVSRNRTALALHIVPFLGHRLLLTLKKEDGFDYIAHRRQEGAAEGTIEREWAVLMALLNSAVENECLDKNRLRTVRSPKGPHRKRVPKLDEIARIRDSVGDARNQRDRAAWADALRVMDVALHTGLRISRLLAIKESDLVHLPDGWWLELPDAKTATKDNPEVVPLNGLAVTALRVGAGHPSRWADLPPMEECGVV